MSSNNNINTNIAQIIFPPDMELRKIKKRKKKPKKRKKKKEAIEGLKETLTTFDNLVNQAQENNIQLDEELISLPQDPSKLNSIKEVKSLTEDLKNRIQLIQELISEKLKPRNMLLDGDVSVPFFRKPQLQPVIPSAVQPMIIPPRQIIPEAQPIRPPPTPARPSQAGQELDKLRKEILSRLTPEERAEAEKQIGKIDEPLPKLDDILEREKQLEEKKKAGDIREQEFNERLKRLKDLEEMIREQQAEQKPPPPTKPVVPEKQEDQADLITQDVRVGEGKFVKVKAPKGWFEIEDRFRRYIENVVFETEKLDEGIYRIPDDKYVGLKKQQQDLLADYNKWIGSLNKAEKDFINTDPRMINFDKEIYGNLNWEPKHIVKAVLEQKGVKVKEITQGTEEPMEEKISKIKLSEKGKKYQTQLEKASEDIKQFKTNLQNYKELNIPVGEVQTILGMIQSTAVNMDKGYSALNVSDRAKLIVEKEVFNELQNETQLVASTIIGQEQQASREKPDIFKENQSDSPEVKIIKRFINNPASRLSKKTRNAVVSLGEEINQEAQFLQLYDEVKTKSTSEKKQVLKDIYKRYYNNKAGIGGEAEPFKPPRPREKIKIQETGSGGLQADVM